jgi:hypothetical protein
MNPPRFRVVGCGWSIAISLLLTLVLNLAIRACN